MARATPLPQQIGDCHIDNAHAECLALILLEEWIPYNVPALIIMDSEAERDRYNHLRTKENSTNRFFIRSLMSGVSKCLGSRLARVIADHKQESTNIIPSHLFYSNLVDLCLHAKNWCFNHTGEESLWKTSQWDCNPCRTVWAIRSHQLEESFSISPKNRYGTDTIPNRSFVSANQWADNVCNVILRFQRNAFHSNCPRELRKWLPPIVSLGITGPIFSLTFNGVCLDRSVSTAVEHLCDMEFIKRLASRPTQGLIIRLRRSFFFKPEMIGRQSYLRRSLEGKTKTHTRAMYTDCEYRKTIVYTLAKSENWESNSTKLLSAFKLASKSYHYLRRPCCVNALQCDFATDTTTNNHHLFYLENGATANSGLYGNLRHYRFHCLNTQVQAVRNKMTQLLEDHLTSLFKLVSQWGRLGFSTLLYRAMNGLIQLDRTPFHNASIKAQQHIKSQQSKFACISSEEWILLIDSYAEKQNFTACNDFL